MASTSPVCNLLFLIMSVAATTLVSGEQSFLEQPVDTSAIIADAEVILKCSVADIDGDLLWEKDHEIVAFANSQNGTTNKDTHSSRKSVIGDHSSGEYHLRLQNVTLQDDGDYRCYVTESANNTGITSSLIKLTIGRAPAPISIIDSPSISVVVGKPANLTCQATGANPPATMSWLREGESRQQTLYVTKQSTTDESGKLSDSTSVLTLTPTMDDNAKTFECQATNMALDTPRIATITLDVQYAPIVTVQTQETKLREETTVVFRCVVEANPRSVTYAWFKNGDIITGAEGDELESDLTRDDHRATIGCAATNTIGTTEGSLTLEVLYGPKIIESPEGISVDEGSPGSMQCTADGNPSATIKWTRLGSRATLSTMSTLTFDTVREGDVGVYMCTAIVEGFDPVVSYGRLDINGLPEIVSEPIQKAKLKSKARLDCFTSTKPDPHTVVWSWDNVQLKSGSKGRFSVVREEIKDGVQSSLIISKVKQEDLRDYNCTMINDVGAQFFIITLKAGAMEPIIYIIIGVICTAMFIFIMTVILMFYCKRRLKLRKANKGKVDVQIVRRSDSEDSIDKPKRSLSDSLSSSHSKPRYADPHDYVPARRGSRDTHDTWNDSIYHPTTPYNSNWRDSYSYSNRFPRRSYSSNDYIEPDDLPHAGTLPEWKDTFDDDKDKPESVADDRMYNSYTPERRDSQYREPPTYDTFRDRYEEDDEYESGWPDSGRRYSNDDSMYSKDYRYNERYNDYGGNRNVTRDDYDDRGYDRLSNIGSDVSQYSNQKLATNV